MRSRSRGRTSTSGARWLQRWGRSSARRDRCWGSRSRSEQRSRSSKAAAMPSGSIIRYDGARGVVWRIKYRDGTGRQVMETLGREEDGWNPKRAEEALEERRVQVRKSGFRRPELLTFRQYAERWFAEEEAKRGWEPTTVAAYVSVRRRLVDAFGSKRLAQIRPRDIADYVAFLSGEGLSASVVHRDIAVLSAMFKSAKAAELVEQNPVEGAERPKLPPFKPPILTP